MNKRIWTHWRMDAAGVAIVAGLGAIAYMGMISPTIARHEQGMAQAEQLVTQKAKSSQLELTLTQLKEHLAATERSAAASQIKLEPLSELNQRLARITELATACSMQVDVIESGTTTNRDRYAITSIRVSGRGTYRNCANALRQMRAAMPDVGVISMDLSSGGVNIDTTGTFLFELLWYTQRQPVAAKK